MGAPSDQFLRLLCGGPFKSVSSHTTWGAPSGQFLRLLYGGPPQVSFFAYYMGAPLRSGSSLTIGGTPQVSFFAYYMGGPSNSVSSLTIWGPLRSISSLTIWGPPRISFFAYYMGPPQIYFFAYLVGAPSDKFFTYYMGAPSGQFLCLLYGVPLIFFKKIRVKLSLGGGGPHICEFPGGGQVPPLAPPPAGAHAHTCSALLIAIDNINTVWEIGLLHTRRVMIVSSPTIPTHDIDSQTVVIYLPDEFINST